MKQLDALKIPLLGTALIEASAGTGKTYAITTLYVRLVVERKLSVSDILVVTYTRAATSELRDRIRKRLRQTLVAIESGGDKDDTDIDLFAKERLEQGEATTDRARLTAAIRSFDQASIFTIHSFCQRVLQDSAFESGASFDTAFITEQASLLSEIGDDYWARELYRANPLLVRFLLRGKKPVTPDLIADIADQATKNPTIPVLPEVAADSEALQEWHDAQTKARELWLAEKDTILELLTSSAMNGNKYRQKSVYGNWSRWMDATLAETNVGIVKDFEKAFPRFTPEGLAAGTKKGNTAPEHPFFEVCDSLAAADLRLSSNTTRFLVNLAQYARSELDARKRASGVQSFGDLLHRLGDALAGDGGKVLAKAIRDRFPAALIDEFQDTDPVQYGVFKAAYQDTSDEVTLFLIGDPKQAIYGFRGADIFAYMNARNDAGEDGHTLGVNWRSDPRYIRAVNTIFKRAQSAFVYDEIEFNPVEQSPEAKDLLGGSLADAPALEFRFVERQGRADSNKQITKGWSNRHLHTGVAREIAQLLASDATIEDKSVVPGDIAVLVRSNRQARLIQGALRRLRVPSVVEGDASVFDTAEAFELERVIAAVVDPSHSRALVAALTSDLLGVSGDETSALQASDLGWEQWIGKFRSWHKTWAERGFIQAYRQLLSDEGVAHRVLAYGGGERALTNLYHLGELLQAQSVSASLGPQALYRWMHLMRTDEQARADGVGDTGQIRLESDADAVKIVTIHKSKGLEYPVVYCPYLWDGKLPSGRKLAAFTFHDPDDDNKLKLDLGSDDFDDHLKVADKEALAESLRLLYVALTRAKHRCTVHWGAFKDSESSALGFLLHQPADFTAEPSGLKEVYSTIKGKEDDQLRDELGALVAASEGAISLSNYQLEDAIEYEERTGADSEYVPKFAVRPYYSSGRFSSFSALLHERQDEGQERDVDSEFAPAGALLPVEESEQEAEALVLVRLAEFPRGSRVGSMMHEAFENADFLPGRKTPLVQVASEALARFGFEDTLSKRLAGALNDALTAPLSCPATQKAMTLSDLSPQDRLDEMEFLFPVQGASGPVTGRSLSAILKAHSPGPWPETYPDEVGKLGFTPLTGFMKGFVDLIFCRDGRWYFADYKSNFLGKTVADYQPAKLSIALAKSHYYLQYLIYMVALHRYLQTRLADYSYEEHIGGVYYFFVRGMSPAHPSGTGVFSTLPPKSLIEDLSRLFGGVEMQGAA